MAYALVHKDLHGTVKKMVLNVEMVSMAEGSSVDGENRREGDEALLGQVPLLHKEWGVRDLGKGSTGDER
jgi:hypothetical protein